MCGFARDAVARPCDAGSGMDQTQSQIGEKVAVVLAAGRGARIQGSNTLPKPLVELCARPILVRTLDTLQAAGIERSLVIVGYRARDIERVLAGFTWPRMSVETVFNPAYEGSNGMSVLAASHRVRDRFIVTMADHLLDRRIVTLALESDPVGGAVLCVDRKLATVFDIADATKVATQDGRIRAIGKHLSEYDAVDTGVFHCSRALSSALQAIRDRTGDCSVSDGMQALALQGTARVADIGELIWQDIDTDEMLAEAGRRLLLAGMDEDAAPHRLHQ
jgi:1L-myo-inositol 1-phosphate cytidylyltransferase